MTDVGATFITISILFGCWIIRDSIITLAKVIEQGNEIKAADQKPIKEQP